jgi:hypothetical protein
MHAVATDGVLASARLRQHGMTSHAIAARCRLGGPWQRVLPGVILVEPTKWQQLLAAHCYAGPVSRRDRTRRAPSPGHPCLRPSGQVLVPVRRRIMSRACVNLERTSRLPEAVRRNDIAFAPPPRATIDAARQETAPGSAGTSASATALLRPLAPPMNSGANSRRATSGAAPRSATCCAISGRSGTPTCMARRENCSNASPAAPGLERPSVRPPGPPDRHGERLVGRGRSRLAVRCERRPDRWSDDERFALTPALSW